MAKEWIIPTVLIAVAVGLGLAATMKPKNPEKPFDGVSTKELLDLHDDKPTLWLYYNTADVNGRYWSDFGARSSRVLNKPYLNLCYSTIVEASKENYKIVIINGLADAIQRLGGLDFVPSPLRNPKAFLLEEEVQFLEMAFLAKFGGLWISPSTICIRDIPAFPKESIICFGTSDTETYSGKEGTPIPNTHYIWCPKPDTPVFQKWASILFERLDGYGGGQRARRDNQWDWTFVTTGECSILTQPNATVQRKKNGRRIELEDLLASGTEGDIPFPIGEDAIFVPIPFYELDRRSQFQWFLRSSEEQIMESDIAIKYLFESRISSD